MPKSYILTGLTGSGKTRLLQYLHKIGHQVLDLEHISQHSGSVLGGINRSSQHTQASFNQSIWNHIQGYAEENYVFMEWKGTVLGELFLPQWLVDIQMKSPKIFIDTPYHIRLQHILKDYSTLTHQQLTEAYQKIETKIPIHLKAEMSQCTENQNRLGLIEAFMAYFDTSPNYATLKTSASAVINTEGGFDEEWITKEILNLKL